MQIDGLEVHPFVLGWPPLAGAWARRSPLEGTRLLDVLDPAHLGFFRRLNAANALAYGGLAMPAWVQLDVCTLPSAVVGFAVERAVLPGGLEARLEAEVRARFPAAAAPPADPRDLVPVAGFCALPTAEPGTVTGLTLFSLLPGARLGLRAKALGLLLMGARRNVGITRREGPARRAHERLGPLRVLHDRPAPHPEAQDSLLYELEVPAAAELEAIVRTGRRRGSEAP